LRWIEVAAPVIGLEVPAFVLVDGVCGRGDGQRQRRDTGGRGAGIA
jgi:hypothetical protein